MATTKTFPAPQPYAAKPRPPIPLLPVTSSQIAAIGYDEDTRTLAVQFKHGAGAIYHYGNVLPEVHSAFVKADSVGTYFGKHIKRLPFDKYPPDAPAAQQAAA